MDTRSPDAYPGPTLAEALDHGAASDGSQVYFLYVKTDLNAAAGVARNLAMKPGVRWATELLHPEMTVFAAAVVQSLDELETLRTSVREIQGVLNPTAVQVVGGAYYERGTGARKVHNGWP